MRLEELSKSATRRLLDYLGTHLSDAPAEFREDVLHAVRIAAPLRERSYLVRIGAELSGSEWACVEPFAFAAELFMISALTADDVIDGSFLRSGEPTLQIKADSSRAILVAEYLHSVGHRVLSERVPAITADAWVKAADEFRSAMSDLLFHQYLQSSLEGDASVTVDQIDKLARGRTGRLIEACLTAPAVVSGSPALRDSLRECGRWLGMALQHRDDILDCIAAPDIIGKPVLLDLLAGQPNLVLSHAFSETNDHLAKAVLLKYFGARHADTDVARRAGSIQREILSVLRASNSLTFASQVVRDYCDRAADALADVPSSRARDELTGFIGIVAVIELPWEDD